MRESAVVDVGQRVEVDLLSVVTGEKRGPRGPAAGRVVELRVADAVGGQRVEIGRGDFAAVAAGVGEAHVVGEKDQKVGTLRFRSGAKSLSRGERNQ